jgi:iron-sulfur cluster repair protein YtfE (RIC family)
MIKFDSSQKIGDIVVTFPKAADILKEYKIDFCCRGNRPLAEAIEAQGLDEKEVLGKINDLYEKYHTEQREKINMPIFSILSLPVRSANRPKGTDIAAAARIYPLITHPMAAAPA